MVAPNGKPLGKYRLQERVGRGGMAEVYRAYQPGLERTVAIKILHPHLAETSDFVSRFKREAQAIALLHHPHIVQVYDFDIDGDRHYMVMEYVEGQTLKTRLDDYFARGERMPLPDILNLFRILLDAVGYAHAHQIAHRDLKPGNVILDVSGRPVLTDFGIAKIIGGSRLTDTGITVGTPAYMSPEQGQGESGDTRSDIYAIGIMLYECLTGQVPYDGDTSVAVMLKHISHPIPSLRQIRPDLSPALEEVVNKALAKDPNQRYQTAAEMWEALAATLNDSEIRAITASPEIRPTRYLSAAPLSEAAARTESAAPPGPLPLHTHRRRRAIAAVGLLAVVGLALAGLFAVLVLPRLLGLSPASQAVAEGQRLLAEGKYQLAADTFSTALQRSPANIAAYLGRAQAYEGLGSLDKALADVERVIALAPQNAAGYQERGRLGLQYGLVADPDSALADLNKAVALAPRSARGYFLRGWALLNFSFSSAAVSGLDPLADLQKAAMLEPQNAEIQLTLAQALLSAGRPADALAPASRAIENNPQAVLPHAVRAHIQFALGDYHSAIDDLTAAGDLETDPTAAATLLAERGYLDLRLHSPAEAQADLNLALSRDANSMLAGYLKLLLDPSLPRPSAEQARRVQGAAPDDPIWQAILADVVAAP